ncbi:hypothetical protein [Tessaracoccus defluvii]|uniref:Nuclear transport factor 2 family protein n=1 Tax=Tessaracoccus defluvii TaxID=1285901 RepID=A0A7H0H2C1_9ACTN|nr:hypothetical protein [Tessaracoccus defluvii]QNP54687.1 hypothetical protein H9L22_10225 [Tessaracoccus defluvii]
MVESYPADLPTGDPESAAIVAGWQEYFRVYEKYAADPLGYSDFSELMYVTTGDEANEVLDGIAHLREEDLRVEGGLQIRDVSVSTPVPDDLGIRTATVKFCSDSSRVRLFRISTGERVLVERTLLEAFTMEEGADGKWRVAKVRNQAASC